MAATHHDQFLGLPPCPIKEAECVIVPLPLERTVSYGGGTAGGPEAIIKASSQIELFDEETLVDFQRSPKIHTALPVLVEGELEDYLRAVSARFAGLHGKFPLALGGEHTVTYGVVKGLAAEPRDVTVVSVDAHADLIDELHGRRWSHGTVMRRLWEEGCRVVEIGVRSLSRAEYEFARSQDRVRICYAHQMAEQWSDLMAGLRALEGAVYLSVDVDGLDPAAMPSTGTPQPGGLSWAQMMDVIRAVMEARAASVLGADIVEFVPSPHPPGCDIVAAKLAARLLAVWALARRR